MANVRISELTNVATPTQVDVLPLVQAGTTFKVRVNQLTTAPPAILATVDPTVIDDADDGYVVAQRWINTVLKTAYTLVDSTPGAAVWTLDSNAGGSGGSPTGAAGGDLFGTYPNPSVLQVTPVAKTLTYNGDGTLATVSDIHGTKTFNYTDGKLTSVTGTGQYSNLTLSYTGDNLTSVTVS